MLHNYCFKIGRLALLWVRNLVTRCIEWDETCLTRIIVIKSTDVVGLVLRVEKKMHVIEQPLPPAPEAGAEPNIVAQWTALYDNSD
ncbi:hypothetical protein Tco_0499106 [Tanacetum coccineum]